MITVRRADAADAAAIARVQVETWRAAYRGIVPDEFLEGMSVEERAERWERIVAEPAGATFVAVDERSGIVGFASGGPERDRVTGGGELYAIYVLPAFKGRGIGRRLAASVAGWLVETGFETASVWVLEENPHRRFYERLGGTQVARREITIGGRTLGEVAYGWGDVRVLRAAAEA